MFIDFTQDNNQSSRIEVDQEGKPYFYYPISSKGEAEFKLEEIRTSRIGQQKSNSSREVSNLRPAEIVENVSGVSGNFKEKEANFPLEINIESKDKFFLKIGPLTPSELSQSFFFTSAWKIKSGKEKERTSRISKKIFFNTIQESISMPPLLDKTFVKYTGEGKRIILNISLIFLVLGGLILWNNFFRSDTGFVKDRITPYILPLVSKENLALLLGFLLGALGLPALPRPDFHFFQKLSTIFSYPEYTINNAYLELYRKKAFCWGFSVATLLLFVVLFLITPLKLPPPSSFIKIDKFFGKDSIRHLAQYYFPNESSSLGFIPIPDSANRKIYPMTALLGLDSLFLRIEHSKLNLAKMRLSMGVREYDPSFIPFVSEYQGEKKEIYFDREMSKEDYEQMVQNKGSEFIFFQYVKQGEDYLKKAKMEFDPTKRVLKKKQLRAIPLESLHKRKRDLVNDFFEIDSIKVITKKNRLYAKEEERLIRKQAAEFEVTFPHDKHVMKINTLMKFCLEDFASRFVNNKGKIKKFGNANNLVKELRKHIFINSVYLEHFRNNRSERFLDTTLVDSIRRNFIELYPRIIKGKIYTLNVPRQQAAVHMAKIYNRFLLRIELVLQESGIQYEINSTVHNTIAQTLKEPLDFSRASNLRYLIDVLIMDSLHQPEEKLFSQIRKEYFKQYSEEILGKRLGNAWYNAKDKKSMESYHDYLDHDELSDRYQDTIKKYFFKDQPAAVVREERLAVEKAKDEEDE